MSWQVLPEYPIGTIGQSCIMCHSDLRNLGNTSKHEDAISTGVSLDFEGIIVFCKSCIIEAANMFGMIPEEKADELRKNNRELGRQNKRYEEELDKARSTIRGLTDLFGIEKP